MSKYYTYKENATKEEIKENPFDLLKKENLVNNEGEIQNFYTCSIDGKLLAKLTLSDFVNDGIDIIQSNSKTNNKKCNYARIGSSGYGARIGSSGDYAQIGSSGYGAQIGSSGDYARIGSSGYGAQIGSSGDYARIGSSGNGARIGSSGYGAQIGSSGDYARIGSSGNGARIGSSGDGAQIGSSGYGAQIGSSGNGARIGSSGNGAQINITGGNSISFGCGVMSIIKGVNGTWLSLAEYTINKDGIYIPCFAKSAQIGNTDYKDCFNKTLRENQYYELINKEFTPVIDIDGDRMVILSTKKTIGEFTIFKAQYKQDFISKGKGICYIANRGEYYAHGKTIKQAISDVVFKFLQNQDVGEHIKRVKEQGHITPNDYRLITGACQCGTNRWLEENGFTWEDKKSIDEVIKLTEGQYGHERLVELLGDKE